ncbi:MAG: ABC transporter substrate-binding protein [Synergistales bacterium]|nr:ABC transporter substrate-binding protein [Synergistales bacterium]
MEAVRGMVSVVVVCLVLALSVGNCGAAVDPVEEEWLLQVAVVPPAQGWDSPEGTAAAAALEYVERETNSRRDGVAGNDIRFVEIEPATMEDLLEDATSVVERWKSRRVVAVVSFADAVTTYDLLQQLAGSGFALILAFGRDVSLADGEGEPFPSVFALDLYKRYTIRAVAARASRALPQGTGIAILADRLDPFLAESTRLLQRDLGLRGFSPLPIWIAGYADRNLRNRLLEASSAGAEVVVSLLGPLGTLDVWTRIERNALPMELWHAGGRNEMVRARPGVLVVDQEWPLEHAGRGLQDIRMDIWDSTGVMVDRMPLAVRSLAAGTLVVQGLQASGGKGGTPLYRALEGVGGLPFGDRTLAIDASTHRPGERRIAVLSTDGETWRMVDTVAVQSRFVPE